MRNLTLATLIGCACLLMAPSAFGEANLDAFRSDCAEPRIPGNWKLQAAACLVVIEFAADDDERAHAYYEHGNALEELDLNGDAIESYDRAIELKPDFVDAIVNRGLTYRRIDEFDRARENYDLAVRIDPDHEIARINRSMIALMQDRHQDAIRDLDHVLSLNPDNAVAYNNRAQARVNLGHHEAALEDYGAALRLLPDNPHLLIGRATTYLAMDRIDDGLSDLHAALRVSPDSPSVHDHLADIHASDRYGQPDLEKAMNHAFTYAELRPDDVMGHYRVAVLATRQGDIDRAVAAHRKIIEDFFYYQPSYQDALVAKGFLDENHSNSWDEASHAALRACVEAGCILFSDD